MIKTKRLIIRPLNYYELLCRLYSCVGFIKSEDDRTYFIDNTVSKMNGIRETSLEKFCTIWIAENSIGQEILECGYICPPTPQKVLEVFCYTKDEFKGKGYGTEAINGLTKYAGVFDVDYVCASVKEENLASQRMMEKAGYYHLTNNKGYKIYNYHLN